MPALPYVIEPAAGLTRHSWRLIDAYTEDEALNTKGGMDKRTALRLTRGWRRSWCVAVPHADLSPKAWGPGRRITKMLEHRFDDAGAIGRRYRRQDEVGTCSVMTSTAAGATPSPRERDAKDRAGRGAAWLTIAVAPARYSPGPGTTR